MKNRWLDVVIGFFLMAAVFAVFCRVLSAGFLAWDDDLNITGNPHIRALDGAHLHWIFTDCDHVRRYVPLAWLIWAVMFRFLGLNPVAYHALNLLLHAANTLLVFRLLRTLMDLPAGDSVTRNSWRANVCAGVAALLWAVNPLRVEVVAWANCEIYTEAVFLLLLSLLSYLRYAKSRAANMQPLPPSPARKVTWYLLSVLLFACSLLVYPVGLAFVVVLVILDLYPRGPFSSLSDRWRDPKAFRFWADKLPFLIVALGNLFINLWARAHASGIWAQPTLRPQEFTIWHRLAQAFYIWAHCFWKPLCPVNLSPVYTTLVSFQPTQPVFVISFCLVASATAVLLLLRRRWSLGLACWVSYLALLVPMLGLTEHPYYPSDRYSYVVGVLLSILIAAGLSAVWHYSRARVCSLVSFLALAGVLGCLSLRQTRIWHDSETLFRYVIANLKSDAYASDIHWRLGIVFEKQQKLADAQAQFETALSLSPNLARVRSSLGLLLMIQGKTAEAITHLQEAVRLNAGDAEAHNNLGIALVGKGLPDEAISQFQEALRLKPDLVQPRDSLGLALAGQGRLAEAIDQFQEALKLDPGFALAHYDLGNVLLQRGRVDEARFHLEKALQIQPDFADAHNNLGNLLLQKGQVDEAIAHFQKALAVSPAFADALSNLGGALLQKGQTGEAIAQFQKALAIAPNDALTRYNLGSALLKSGRLDQAIAQFQSALEIRPEFAEACAKLGMALLQKGQVDEAITHLRRAAQLNPNLANVQSDLGTLLLQKGRADDAVAHYQAALAIQPANAFFLNNLAWVLATCPKPQVRNGPKAVELAQQAERLGGAGNPAILGTLAAAYAEAGRFPEAVSTAQHALELATAQTNSAQLDMLRTNIALYQAGFPFRDASHTNALPKPNRP